jgi:hypothetical protein
MAQDFESNGARVTNSATTIYTSNSDDAVVGLRLANILTAAVTGDTPGGESFPEYDSTIDKDQIVKNSVVAGPITLNATITVEGNLVVV